MFFQKGHITLVLGAVVLFAIAAILFLGQIFGSKEDIPDQKYPEARMESAESQYATPSATLPVVDNTIKFDVEKAKVGDKLGGMTIIKLGGSKSNIPTANSAFVQFKGKVEVTGKISYFEPGGFMAEAVCLGDLDEDSLAKMPKIISDTRVVWFCFNDLEAAKKLRLHTETKPVTVVIDNYLIIYHPSEVYNTADLVEVK